MKSTIRYAMKAKTSTVYQITFQNELQSMGTYFLRRASIVSTLGTSWATASPVKDYGPGSHSSLIAASITGPSVVTTVGKRVRPGLMREQSPW
ncbi:hypothetical protein GCM10009855_02760 [Gordonia cholesterolivorans]|uniref:Uncharacterized protein n=1 Tax=Gordonia cholesterolivorans TaxID=559625 RepID=A0ABP5U1H8_9ACTN